MNVLDRRQFLRLTGVAALAVSPFARAERATKRPNILFCISDDQTWLHCSAYGSKMVKTPHFDRVAREGVLFKNAFVSVPSCNPSRSSVLTGMPFYRLKEASMNHTPWPPELNVYTDMLASMGYHVGFTGKGCGPTDWKAAGRKTNPAGLEYNKRVHQSGSKGISNTDYAGNFQDFLKERPQGSPFCFWYGGRDPHRVFKEGIGLREGKKLSDAEVPPFYPDSPEIRSDLLDYAVHIEWFDKHLGRMMDMLKEIGELDNTLIVVTGDNGMAFPRCKATCYEFGIHMPLAIRWGSRVKPGRVVNDLVSFTDFAPTFLEAAGASVPKNMTGKSLLPILQSNRAGQVDPHRDHVVVGVERHFPGGRKGGWGYPIRAIRTERFLYIRNLTPNRWPTADPDGPVWPADDPTGGFGDCDGSPTKTYLCTHRRDQSYFFNLAFGKRPADELYDIKNDPYQLRNLADQNQYAEIKMELAARLKKELIETQDPRALGKGQELDDYALKYQKSL
ncbi:MAG: sulfatase [Sedimentisphaerales bacterium]|nr:sulfatase [Sedimentisphaerales bacterium]